MIELRQRLPAGYGVAPFAVRSQLFVVAILMAAQASGVQSFERPVQVTNLYKLAVGSSDSFSIVAFLTVQPGVFAHQRIARLGVVEFLFGSLPFVDPEVSAVVFSVTPSTFRVSLFRDAPVVALVLTHQRANLPMTPQAPDFEGTRTESVASTALEGAF
jgi:hypothetical protein